MVTPGVLEAIGCQELPKEVAAMCADKKFATPKQRGAVMHVYM